MTIANTEMARAWEDEATSWTAHSHHYDQTIRAYHAHLLGAAAVTSGERVLDVGCGTGEVTRDAARASAPAGALGVDISPRMVDRARELATEEGVGNAVFEVADAQTYPFDDAAFDVVLSRFGSMFFADPEAAYANLARATAAGGRLAMTAWQPLDVNAWQRELRGILAAGRELPPAVAGVPGPFGLADPGYVRTLLTRAGFADVDIQGIEEEVWLGADPDDAFRFVTGMGLARSLLAPLDDGTRTRTLDAVRALLEAHAAPDGVLLGGAAWLILARRPA
jgi:ubiquinone/menaquinone biosynthesis C-methylase UbiE